MDEQIDKELFKLDMGNLWHFKAHLMVKQPRTVILLCDRNIYYLTGKHMHLIMPMAFLSPILF